MMVGRLLCRLGVHGVRCRGRWDHTVVDGRTVLRRDPFTLDGLPPRLPRRQVERELRRRVEDLSEWSGASEAEVAAALTAALHGDAPPLEG